MVARCQAPALLRHLATTCGLKALLGETGCTSHAPPWLYRTQAANFKPTTRDEEQVLGRSMSCVVMTMCTVCTAGTTNTHGMDRAQGWPSHCPNQPGWLARWGAFVHHELLSLLPQQADP